MDLGRVFAADGLIRTITAKLPNSDLLPVYFLPTLYILPIGPLHTSYTHISLTYPTSGPLPFHLTCTYSLPPPIYLLPTSSITPSIFLICYAHARLRHHLNYFPTVSYSSLTVFFKHLDVHFPRTPDLFLLLCTSYLLPFDQSVPASKIT